MRITRKLIDERLKRVESCEIEWFGARHSNESDITDWESVAETKLQFLTARDVQSEIDRNEYSGTIAEIIDLAIESASAPDDLPENACVAVRFTENHDHYIAKYENCLGIDVYAVIDRGIGICQNQEDISVVIAIYRKYWPKGDLWLCKNGEFQNLSTTIGAELVQEGVTI